MASKKRTYIEELKCDLCENPISATTLSKIPRTAQNILRENENDGIYIFCDNCFPFKYAYTKIVYFLITASSTDWTCFTQLAAGLNISHLAKLSEPQKKKSPELKMLSPWTSDDEDGADKEKSGETSSRRPLRLFPKSAGDYASSSSQGADIPSKKETDPLSKSEETGSTSPRVSTSPKEKLETSSEKEESVPPRIVAATSKPTPPPKPQFIPKPAVKSKRTAKPEPAPEPEPTPKPEPASIPEATPKPEETPQPELAPKPKATPKEELTPKPGPAPKLEPTPKPESTLKQEPTPKPGPAPKPKPTPEPTSKTEPTPPRGSGRTSPILSSEVDITHLKMIPTKDSSLKEPQSKEESVRATTSAISPGAEKKSPDEKTKPSALQEIEGIQESASIKDQDQAARTQILAARVKAALEKSKAELEKSDSYAEPDINELLEVLISRTSSSSHPYQMGAHRTQAELRNILLEKHTDSIILNNNTSIMTFLLFNAAYFCHTPKDPAETSGPTSCSGMTMQNRIVELVERFENSYIVLIGNVPEKDVNITTAVKKICEQLLPGVNVGRNYVRICLKEPDTVSPIKLTLPEINLAQRMLEFPIVDIPEVGNGITISRVLTEVQKRHQQTLLPELQRRQQAGESVIIDLVNGEPTIVPFTAEAS